MRTSGGKAKGTYSGGVSGFAQLSTPHGTRVLIPAILKRLPAAAGSLSILFAAQAWAQASRPVTPATVIPVVAGDSREMILAKAANVIPARQQLAWQRGEMIGFVHFGINTFTDREWGTGTESPALFNPSALDARQWMRAFKSEGIAEVVLVVKHHDGFVLYPTRYTTHSVKASPWLKGQGDVMRAFTDAAREAGLKVGFYLSPADLYQKQQGIFGNRSAARTTRIPTLVAGDDRRPREFLTYELDDYNRYFMNQMYELLTEYGPISEVWLDGAPAAGSGQPYAFTAWYDIVHRLQPNAVIFNQNVRWVGNEDGKARQTEWSVIPLANDYNLQPSGDLTDADLGSRARLFSNGVHFLAWYPAEADVSIRPGWFWHAAQDVQIKSLDKLMQIYYATVGRNAVMMLNVPPDRRGLFTDRDVRRLKAFGDRIRDVFKSNLAEDAWKSAQRGASGNLVVDLNHPVAFNRIMLGEDIAGGQRVESFAIDVWTGTTWKEIAAGTTIGYKRLFETKTVRAPKVRIRILQSRAPASITSFGLFLER
jgi:alpha-L-fucosidase